MHSLCFPKWLLASDFNIIVRWLLETNVKHTDKKNMTLFDNFIQNNGFIDPPLINSSYTWSNIRLNPTFSRLDRFRYTSNWEQVFKPHHSKTLQRTVSNHFPISMESPQIKWGPWPFRLNCSSFNEKFFIKNIQSLWKNTYQGGHPGYSFIHRLKVLAADVIKNSQKE